MRGPPYEDRGPEGPGAGTSGARPGRGMHGERRTVTVLFCDVAGSTAMAERLDPEEWAEIMNEAFEYLTGPVQRYEGTVARLMGDAILAFFGAPTAHEDDPERAVLAGLDIVSGITPFREQIEREYGLDFNVRVGINTGPVVVGDVGSQEAGEYTAMGEAVNLAARMEQTAGPGVVQVSSNTYKLVSPLFDFESLGRIEVKGVSEPVQAYRVLSRKTEPGRLRGIHGLAAPMIGREQEVATLSQVLGDVRQGRGNIVCLMGDAGLGKSRMIEELRGQWSSGANGALTWLESRGISYDTTRPYTLFLQQLQQICGAGANDPLDVVVSKIAAGDIYPELAPALNRVVDVLMANGSGNGAAQLEGEAVKQELFDAMEELWRQLNSRGPAVMVLDDLHWSDPASVELLLHLFQLAEEASILFLCSFRPDRRSPAWRVKQTGEGEYPHRSSPGSGPGRPRSTGQGPVEPHAGGELWEPRPAPGDSVRRAVTGHSPRAQPAGAARLYFERHISCLPVGRPRTRGLAGASRSRPAVA